MERPNAWLTYSDADMKDLETVAKKYGMVKPDSKHTLRYESQDAEYIRQYGKIPKAD